jgi:Escherichia/Staphylococcus phage prohead protease
MLHKTFDIIDTKTDADTGTFEALVSVFGNVARVGDRVMPGAFQKTLARWRESGDPIPVILSHQWNDPMAHIGVVEDAMEAEKGLLVRGRLDVADNPVAQQVHKLMKRRSLREFSFGYSVPKGGQKRGKDGANELLEVDLVEVGPTLKGANPDTELHAVKAAIQETHLANELEDVKAQLAKAREELDALKSKAEEAGKEPEARSVDPLRKQAESVALEFASAGLSLRKPPRTVPAPKREPELPLDDLKRRMRDEILTHLSGGTTT